MNPKRQSNTLTKKKKPGSGAEQNGNAMPYFDGMVEYIPEALIATDNQHVVIGWNAAAERIYGWKAEEVLGKTLKDVLQTEYQDTQRDHVISKARETGNWLGEVTQLRKDGKRIPIRSSVSVVKDAQGTPIGYIGINCDISDQKQVEEQVNFQAARLKILADASQAFATAGQDYHAVLDQVTRQVAEALADMCQIRLLSDDGQLLKLAAIYSRDSEFSQALHKIAHSISERTEDPGMAPYVFRTGKPAFVPVITTEQLLASLPPEFEGIDLRFAPHSYIVVALRVQGRSIGVLALTRYQTERPSFTEDDVTLAQDLADRAALAINSAHLFDQVQEELAERKRVEKQVVQMKRLYATLSQVNQMVVRVKDHDELYRSICDVAAKFGEFSLVWVGLLDEGSGDIRPVAAVGQDINHWPFAPINIRSGQSQDGLVAGAIRTSKVVTSEDIGNDERIKAQTELFQKYGYHSTAVVPFRLRGKTIGVVSLVSDTQGFFNSEDEIRLLDEMGLDISFALDTMETEAERKRAENELKENNSRLELAMRSANMAWWEMDITNGNVKFEKRKTEMLGYPSENFKHYRDFMALVHPEDSDVAMNAMQRHIDGLADKYEVEYRILTKSGGYKWFYDIGAIIKKDPKGLPLYATGLVIDITERKRAEQSLINSEAALKKAQRVAHVGSWAWHTADNRLEWSDEMYRIFGIEKESFTGLLSDAINLAIHPDDRAAVEAANQLVTQEQSPIPMEYRVVWSDGTVRTVWAEAGELVLNDKGQAEVLTGIVQDITERKQAEDQLQESERKLKLFVEYAPAAIAMFDRDMKYIAASRRFLADYNLKDENIIGRSHYEIFPEISERWKEIHRRCLAGAIEKEEEDPFPRMDGTLDWVRWEIHPWNDRSGEIGGIILFSEVITERKLAEKQVQLQLQRMSALREIDRAISSSLDMRLSLDTVLNQVLPQLGVDAASVLLLNPSSQTLEYVVGKGFRTQNIRQSSMQLGEGFAGRVGLERKVLHIPDLGAMGSQFHRRDLLKEEKFVEYFGIPLVAKGTLKGVLEIFHRTPLDPDLEWLNYLETLGGQAAIAIDNVQLFEGIQQSNRELVTAYDATIAGWSHAMDLRDKETEGHTLRVTELTVRLAKKLGIHQQEIVQMRRGALLHDIGKLGVPDHILLKPGKLDQIEWAIMRQHPSYAYKMLLPITYLRPALDIPYCHHEKWDGSGYPRGLAGEEIPIAARLFAVIDAWDALRSDRPYRAGWTIEKTREHIIEGSGKHFDPQVVEAFLSLLDESPDLR